MSDEERTDVPPVEEPAVEITPEELAEQDAANAPAPANGVFVEKQKDERGNIGVRAQPVGDVEPTEVLTLLELAIDEFRTRVGLRAR